jgi:2-polyprenyl-3-methyl-5-hydroxy-6-metoxy-1,4-benzoquinol methylase
MDDSRDFEAERARGERFGFGDNWRRFLENVDDACIEHAQQALCSMQTIEHLRGRSFVDVGSGSGLSSLVARRLGASVLSFDYDPDSVRCTRALKARYYPGDSDGHADWRIERGSVLEPEYLKSLGSFDVVYSWGVLHHTGAMWQAIDNVTPLVAPLGVLHIALYRTERSSPYWLKLKQLYNRSPAALARLLLGGFALYSIARLLLRGQNPWRVIRDYPITGRGMSWIRDVEDWLGGLPYEHATPEEVRDFLGARGFDLRRQQGMEYVFERRAGPASPSS